MQMVLFELCPLPSLFGNLDVDYALSQECQQKKNDQGDMNMIFVHEAPPLFCSWTSL